MENKIISTTFLVESDLDSEKLAIINVTDELVSLIEKHLVKLKCFDVDPENPIAYLAIYSNKFCSFFEDTKETEELYGELMEGLIESDINFVDDVEIESLIASLSTYSDCAKLAIYPDGDFLFEDEHGNMTNMLKIEYLKNLE